MPGSNITIQQRGNASGRSSARLATTAPKPSQEHCFWCTRRARCLGIRRVSDSPGKSDACPSAEYPRHFLTENVGLHGGLSFPTIQIIVTNRMIQKGLSLVPGGGIEPPRAEARRILRPSTAIPKPLIFSHLQRLAKNGRHV